MKDLIKITSKLVSFKTTADRPKELLKCRDYITSLFNKKGLFIKKYSKANKLSLVISTCDTKDFDIILSGHFDVVPAEKHAFIPVSKGNRLYGRGTSDMKGHVAAMILALLEISKWRKKPKIALMLTSDEEIGGFNGTKYLLEDKKYRSKCVFVPDGGEDFKIILAEKGVVHMCIRAKGKTAHGSRPWLGENAIVKLFDVYKTISKEFPLPKDKDNWGKTVNIGKIIGGDAVNKVPDFAEMYLDIRYTEQTSSKSVVKKVKDICKKVSNVNAVLKIQGSCLFTPKGDKYVQRLEEVMKEVLRRDIKFGKGHGASDGRFFSERKIPVLMTKCKCSEPHIKNEWVNIKSLYKLQEIITLFLENFSSV